MLRADHILCLVPPAPAALKQGMHLAQRLRATLHVMPLPGPETTVEGNELRSLASRLASDEEKHLSLQVAEGPPDSVSAVRQYVVDAAIDLVVTDTPPERGPVPPFSTEVTQALITRLECPVFVVEHAGDPAAIGDLLVPTDLSDPALRALRHAVALAGLYDAVVHVLHVIDSPPYVALTPTDRLSLGSMSLSEHRGRRRLRSFLEEGATGDVPVQAHLAYGDVAKCVVRYANREDIDLMVLSSQGRRADPHASLGQVAERVLERGTCPLFLLRVFGPSLLARPPGSESGTPSP